MRTQLTNVRAYCIRPLLTATLAVAFTFHTSFAQCTASLFAGGAGTAASPYQIGTAEQLQNLNQCLGEDYQGNHYVLNNDIDLTAYLQNSETGWQPIGRSGSGNRFYGNLNGNRHKISGLWSNMPETNYVGLIGRFGGITKDIGVEIDNAKGGIKGKEAVGGLVGYNSSGTISNSYAIGNVTGYEGVGGLAGGNEKSGGIISNSYATGSVTGTGRQVGGLVGTNEEGGAITNCYAIGSVTGSENVGGLVGTNKKSETSGDGTVTNSYYDTQTTGQTDTDKGTGKTTAEMKTQSTYAGWDFETIWEINAAKNSGYPALRWQTNTTPIRLPQIATGSIRVQSIANAIVLENLPKNAKVELYNLQGKQIYSTHSENSQILKIQVQTKGMYIVKVSNQTIRTIVR